MVFEVTITDPLERIKAFFDASKMDPDSGETWGSEIMLKAVPLSAQVLSPTTATATFLLQIPLSLCNKMRNLHGGCAATIFDFLTSMAIAPLSKPGMFSYGGVSRTLGCTYLRPVPEGMTVIVSCEVLAISGRLAATRGIMREAVEVVGSGQGVRWEEKGPILVTCEHGKVNTDAKL